MRSDLLANHFRALMDTEAVIASISSSSHLNGLSSKVVRKLNWNGGAPAPEDDQVAALGWQEPAPEAA